MNMGRSVFSPFLPGSLYTHFSFLQTEAAGRDTFPHGELAVLEVVSVQLQPQQEIVELGDKGPVGEDVAESVGQPGCWRHHCGVQDVGITFGDFRQEWLVFCRWRGAGWRSQGLGRNGVSEPRGQKPAWSWGRRGGSEEGETIVSAVF